MRKTVFFIFIFSIALTAQTEEIRKDIPIDTTFTVFSAAAKIAKTFPFAKLVTEKKSKKVKAVKDIVYAVYGKTEMLLDFQMPAKKSASPLPAVIIIHGGGWHSGNKTMEQPIAFYLAEKGYITANIQYRLAAEKLYPAAVYDIKAAVRWLRANALQYNIDTNKIAVLGCSAGAELATFVGVTNGLAQFEGEDNYLNHSSSVEAIVNIDGLVDFTHINSTKYDENPKKPCAANIWLGGSFKNKPELWKEASPINYVSKNSPPIVFINSALEDYHAGRDEYINRLKQFNIYYEMLTISNTPHPFWLFSPWYEETCSFTLNFLNNVFNRRTK